MPRYISLIRHAEKGAHAIKQSTGRAHAFDKAAARAGVKIEGQYWTLGQYDGVLIMSASREEQALHCLALLASAGFARTETLPAFTDQEFDAITGS
jgi:uncharacterized protein with GYD domain